jgi:hypothetical protein
MVRLRRIKLKKNSCWLRTVRSKKRNVNFYKKRIIKMKRLITICAIVSLMLSLTCVSWASAAGPNVTPPPGAPQWWNQQCEYYAYGWWEKDMELGDYEVSPPADSSHWASNFITNTDFYADVYSGEGGKEVYIYMKNGYQRELKKELYIYLRGTTESTSGSVNHSFYTAEGTFYGDFGGSINPDGTWLYHVLGEIIPQPSYQYLYVNVPGLTSVTDIWVGENCVVPEPATISMLGLGVLAFFRKRKS